MYSSSIPYPSSRRNSPRPDIPILLDEPIIHHPAIAPILAIMQQRYAVEFQKRICDLPTRGRQSRIQAHALQLRHWSLQAQPTELIRHHPVAIAISAFFDVSEVDRVDCSALVGDHGGFHVAEEGPGDGFEERVAFDVGGTGTGAETAHLVFDEEFADDAFAQTGGGRLASMLKFRLESRGVTRRRRAYLDTCGAPEPSGKGTSSLNMFANVAFRFFPLNGVVPKSIS
jgi:hypothetical protein